MAPAAASPPDARPPAGGARDSWCIVVAGDPSGDLHGSHLIRELRAEEPGLKTAAVGGPCMKRAADEFLEDLSSRGLTGFWEPLKSLGFFAKLALRLKRFMLRRSPQAVVCIDYYGFNSLVLRIARGLGIPSYYYISPQVWATRPGRVAVLKRLIRKMLVIFPFEERLYLKAGVPCLFVGHPLIDVIPDARPHHGVGSTLRLGLLPGSRPAEVARHLPLFLDAARRIRRHFPDMEARVFAPESLADEHYAAAAAAAVPVIRESDYAERSRLDFAISSSGTATLENALLGIPMVVVYKLSWPTYLIARALIRVRHIAMVNILAGRRLVPELVQYDATAESTAKKALSLLENPKRYAALRRELTALRPMLGKPGTARRAAREIINEMVRARRVP
ncbi:MAG: lipid-A-disaccharide synthase [Elusimicrobia bacterium]|nr:lipid-A-disaccharide synthase [Elusimicrobiota bacterium]